MPSLPSDHFEESYTVFGGVIPASKNQYGARIILLQQPNITQGLIELRLKQFPLPAYASQVEFLDVGDYVQITQLFGDANPLFDAAEAV